MARDMNMSLFWYPREVLDVSSVRYKIGPDHLKAECPNLSRILNNEVVLKQVRYLPEILRCAEKDLLP